MAQDPSASPSPDRLPIEARAILLVLAACAWCVALYLARRWQTGSAYFFYLVYNLGLAVIPLILSTVITRWNGLGRGRYLAGLAWLLFFPNAPYLVTDLIHLRPRSEAPFWFDWLMLVSFSGAGLLIGHVSLAQVLELLFFPWHHPAMMAYCFGVTVLLGVSYFTPVWLVGMRAPLPKPASDPSRRGRGRRGFTGP